MKLESFRLEHWLDEHGPRTRYDLGASTGPLWTLRELHALMTPEQTTAHEKATVSYGPVAGREGLRRQLAALHGVSAQEVQVLNGGAEGLLAIFFLASEAGANVVVPTPAFPSFTALPEAFGLEVRKYRLREEDAYRLDVDEVRRLTDDHTKLIIVNSPNSPTGCVSEEEALRELHDFALDRGIQFLVDEVFHPIYHDRERPSAARLPRATVLGDFSKALCLGGLRVGWIIDHDLKRLQAYRNARGYFTASNSFPGEALAEVALEHREVFWARARDVASRNLALLDEFFKDHADLVQWVRPRGGFTGFPRLLSGADSRPLALAAIEKGVLIVPGDCFGYPSYFRLGFGACVDGYAEGLEILATELRGAACGVE